MSRKEFIWFCSCARIILPAECGERGFKNEAYCGLLLVGNIVFHDNGERGMTKTAANPVWLGITNVAVLAVDASTYVASIEIGHVFVLKTPETFTYDANGNMLSDGRWNYTRAAENRLIKVESRPGTPSSSWRRIKWTYDALGRRIQQVTSIWTNNAWFVVENLKFVSDPMLFGRHIVELNGTNNALVRSYAWGLDLSGTMDGVGGVGGLAWVTLHTASGPASGTHFTCYDGNGNIVSLVSGTSGEVTARYEYGPFGEPIRITGPAASLNLFRFSTKRTENNTDLVLYEYRAYSQSLGRWLSRDPIEEYGGQNLYVVVMNSPLIIIDLYGLQITPGIARTDICIPYSAIKVSFFDNWIPNGGDVSKDYTLWYEKRFPNTTYFVKRNFLSVLDALAKARICNGDGISKTQLPSVSINGYGTGERRIVGNTTEYKFGDKEQTPYEAALDLGNYNIRVLEWKTCHKTCESSNCKKGYKRTARVGVVNGLGINPRNLGIDERETSVFIWFCYYFCAESLLFGPERQVIVVSWDLSGEGCCD